MKKEILNKLKDIEEKRNVEILFAVESGSRAWGFASPDSDYDIRFVYKNNTEWYLDLWEKRDTIEFMTEDDLDGSGWDLRKALKLLSKSNASLLGWLFSPEIYRCDEQFLSDMRTLATDNFNPVTGFYHFHSMSKGFEEILGTDRMTLKGYFYAIRTALCAKWIAEFESIPPVLFRELYVLIDEKHQKALDELIAIKALHEEKSSESIEPELLELVRNVVKSNHERKDTIVNKYAAKDEFNAFFLQSFK